MGNSGKIITIIIVAFVGVFILALMQKAGGGGMGFFGIFGIALFFIIKSFFKTEKFESKFDTMKNSSNNSNVEGNIEGKKYVNIQNEVNTIDSEVITDSIQEFTNEQTIAMKSFQLAVENITKLETNFQWLSDDGRIEALIFNSYIILTTIKETNYKQYKEIESTYLFLLIKFTQDYGTKLKIDELGKFINRRLFFYDNEMKNISNNTGYLGSKIYSVMYLQPLSNEPENSFDLAENMKFLIAIGFIAESIKNEVSTIIKKTL